MVRTREGDLSGIDKSLRGDYLSFTVLSPSVRFVLWWIYSEVSKSESRNGMTLLHGICPMFVVSDRDVIFNVGPSSRVRRVVRSTKTLRGNFTGTGQFYTRGNHVEDNDE